MSLEEIVALGPYALFGVIFVVCLASYILHGGGSGGGDGGSSGDGGWGGGCGDGGD